MAAAEKLNRLVNPSQELVDRLATEAQVIEKEVREFAAQLAGLTEDDAIALLNDLCFRRSWNTPTFLAAAELLDGAMMSAN